MDTEEEKSKPAAGSTDGGSGFGGSSEKPGSSNYEVGEQLGSEINVEEFTRMLEALQLRFKDIHDLMRMVQVALDDLRSMPHGVVAQIPDELKETRESLVAIAERAMAASKHAEVTSALAVVTWARLLKRPIKSLIQDVAKVALSEADGPSGEQGSSGPEPSSPEEKIDGTETGQTG
jgi:hypothetical protein